MDKIQDDLKHFVFDMCYSDNTFVHSGIKLLAGREVITSANCSDSRDRIQQIFMAELNREIDECMVTVKVKGINKKENILHYLIVLSFLKQS